MKQSTFEQALAANKEKIYRICRVYAVSPIEPQDLFQEVLFQVWKSMDSFKENAAIDTWVYRIALNVCMRSKLKLEKSSAKTVRFEAIEYREPASPADDEADEKFHLLKLCISRLNDTDTSLILLYLEELSYKQIAEISGLTENHVAVKMKRIRKKLLDCITAKLS